MRVESILAEKGPWVATIGEANTLQEVAQRLAEHRVGALVVSPDRRRVLGLVSERDVARAVALFGPDALHLQVEEVMTRNPWTCGPDDTCDHLMRVMTTRRVRHLPVVVDGELVGLVSIGDVVKRRVDELQEETRTLHEYLYNGR